MLNYMFLIQLSKNKRQHQQQPPSRPTPRMTVSTRSTSNSRRSRGTRTNRPVPGLSRRLLGREAVPAGTVFPRRRGLWTTACWTRTVNSRTGTRPALSTTCIRGFRLRTTAVSRGTAGSTANTRSLPAGLTITAKDVHLSLMGIGSFQNWRNARSNICTKGYPLNTFYPQIYQLWIKPSNWMTSDAYDNKQDELYHSFFLNAMKNKQINTPIFSLILEKSGGPQFGYNHAYVYLPLRIWVQSRTCSLCGPQIDRNSGTLWKCIPPCDLLTLYNARTLDWSYDVFEEQHHLIQAKSS